MRSIAALGSLGFLCAIVSFSWQLNVPRPEPRGLFHVDGWRLAATLMYAVGYECIWMATMLALAYWQAGYRLTVSIR